MYEVPGEGAEGLGAWGCSSVIFFVVAKPRTSFTSWDRFPIGETAGSACERESVGRQCLIKVSKDRPSSS